MDESSGTRPTAGTSLRDVAEMFAELGHQLKAGAAETAYDAITRVAVDRVPGASAVSITTLRANRYRTESATSDLARRADALQYELGSGPCVDAIVEDTTFQPDDLAHDKRWPVLGRRLVEDLGLASMLSFRLNGDFAAGEMLAGLNMYSEQPHGFDDDSTQIGLLLATHAAVVIAAELNRDKVDNLEHALASSREIGVAIGVLMNRHRLTREQGFDLLRIASQRTNRKLRDVAVDVGDTGLLPGQPHP